jgi:hypothetical protein
MNCFLRQPGVLLLLVLIGGAAAGQFAPAQTQFRGTLTKIVVDVYSTDRCQDGAIHRDTTHLVLPASATETPVDISCSWASLTGKIALQIPDVPITGTLCWDSSALCIDGSPPSVTISISAIGLLKSAIDTTFGHYFIVLTNILNIGDTTRACPQPLDKNSLKYPGSVTVSVSSTCVPPALSVIADSSRRYVGNQLVEFNAGHFASVGASFETGGSSWTYGLEDGYGHQHVFIIRSVYKFVRSVQNPEVEVWTHLPVYAGQVRFSSNKSDNVVTIEGYTADIVSAQPESLIVRVPQELVENRGDATKLYNTTPRDVEVIAKVLTGPGQYAEVARFNVRFIPPRLLLFDEVTRPSPPILQVVLRSSGPRAPRTFAFLGRSTDGTAAVRFLNTAKGLARLRVLGKVISPPRPPVYPRGEFYDKSDSPSMGNMVNLGISNTGIQFPVDLDGWYLIVTVADTSSYGPFPTQFQIHLAGNVGLPQKLINGVPEPPRGIRMDTYFNHPAPRTETLVNGALVAGEWAETGLFKFANPVSVTQFPIAVLIPPLVDGFPIGTPPVRAAPPTRMGLLPNQAIDPAIPVATTPGVVSPVPGTIIDMAQVPVPASVLDPSPPGGVANLLGPNNGAAVTLPLTIPSGTISSVILDMGSGNEIVNGAGADLRVVAASGSYQVAVSNTPFANTFVSVGSGIGQQDFDIAGTGLTVARYVRLAVTAGSAIIDGVEALHLFTDQIHTTAGPLADVGWATITVRRQKSPMTPIDPLVELISPDGSHFGENESGFGDDTNIDRSDAALIKTSLTQQGFYRYVVRGYDVTPDEQSFGSFYTRLETAGEYDKVDLTVSTKSEEQTVAQKQGTITLPRQRDSYLFQSSGTSTVNIVVNGTGSPALADPLVELYDPEDFLIAANDNYSAARGRNAVVTVNLPTAGRTFPNPSTYRIVVMGMDKPTSSTTTVGNSVFHVRQENGGKYELKVFTGALAGGGDLTPGIVRVSPDAALQGTSNVQLLVTGQNFVSGATIGFSGGRSGITVKSVTFMSTTQLKVTIDLAADAATGFYDVNVTNPGGLVGSGARMFQVRKTLGQVVLNWTAPAVGPTLPAPANLTAQFNASAGTSAAGKIAIHQSWTGKQNTTTAPGEILAVRRPVQMSPQSVIKEVEPNNSPGQAQVLTGDTLIEVSGRVEVRDVGTVDDSGDDIEDLFKITTLKPGLTVLLSGFKSDCDLYLIDPVDTTIIDASLNTSASGYEYIEWMDLPTGTYLIGVSIYDPQPLGPDSTAYLLQVAGGFGGTTNLTLYSYNVYRSLTANARTTGVKLGNVAVGTTTFSDPVPYTGIFFYQVTALYNQGESSPSNEVSKMVTEVERSPSAAVVPTEYALSQNYPNPFNPTTVVRYQLPALPAGRQVACNVELRIYDMLGREVALLVDEPQVPGSYEVRVDASGLSSGVYLYRLTAGDFVQTKKLVVLR